MKKWFLIFTFAFAFISMSFAPAQAQLKAGIFDQYFSKTFGDTYDTSKTGADLEQSLPAAVGRVINTVLGLIGVIMLVIVVWAGFLWLTARGNTGQVETAQQYIRNAIIGMAIVFGAFIITSFVVTQLERAAELNVQDSQQ